MEHNTEENTESSNEPSAEAEERTTDPIESRLASIERKLDRMNQVTNWSIVFLAHSMEELAKSMGEDHSFRFAIPPEEVEQIIKTAEFPIRDGGKDAIAGKFHEISRKFSAYFAEPLEELGGIDSTQLLAEFGISLYESARGYQEYMESGGSSASDTQRREFLKDLLENYSERIDSELQDGEPDNEDFLKELKQQLSDWLDEVGDINT